MVLLVADSVHCLLTSVCVPQDGCRASSGLLLLQVLSQQQPGTPGSLCEAGPTGHWWVGGCMS